MLITVLGLRLRGLVTVFHYGRVCEMMKGYKTLYLNWKTINIFFLCCWAILLRSW